MRKEGEWGMWKGRSAMKLEKIMCKKIWEMVSIGNVTCMLDGHRTKKWSGRKAKR